jgi:hypothetical protein
MSKYCSIPLYEVKDEAGKHMTRSTTAALPFHRFYQLKEEDSLAEIEEIVAS